MCEIHLSCHVTHTAVGVLLLTHSALSYSNWKTLYSVHAAWRVRETERQTSWGADWNQRGMGKVVCWSEVGAGNLRKNRSHKAKVHMRSSKWAKDWSSPCSLYIFTELRTICDVMMLLMISFFVMFFFATAKRGNAATQWWKHGATCSKLPLSPVLVSSSNFKCLYPFHPLLFCSDLIILSLTLSL